MEMGMIRNSTSFRGLALLMGMMLPVMMRRLWMERQWLGIRNIMRRRRGGGWDFWKEMTSRIYLNIRLCAKQIPWSFAEGCLTACVNLADGSRKLWAKNCVR